MSLIGLLFFVSCAVASTLDFYKTLDSPVRSGQADQALLEASFVSQKTRSFLRVQANREKYQILGSDLLRAKDLCARPEVVVVDLDCRAYVLIDSPVRQKPDLKAAFRQTLSSRSLVSIVEVREHWVRIADPISGWVDVNHLLVASDFAQFAWSPKRQQWSVLRHRGELVELGLIGSQLKLSETLGIVLRAQTGSPLEILNRVQVIGDQLEIWNVSDLTGHGLVYWKAKAATDEEFETHESLARRGIHQIVRSPKNSNVALASAKGIYRTIDGKRWQRLRVFQDQSWPINVDSAGRFLVGHYRETSHGFESFVRWESLVKLIGQPLPKVTIQSVESARPGEFVMKIFTGLRNVTLKSESDGLSWSLKK